MNGNGERIKKVLFNEMSFAIAIIGATVALMGWLMSPSKLNETEILKLKSEFEKTQEITEKLQNIKDNDLHTIELKVNDVEKRVRNVEESLIRIETILEERLPKP